MTTLLPVQCYACTRLNRADGTEGFSELPPVRSCQAFERIPKAIRMGADHRIPVEGEQLLFEQLDSEQAREHFDWWREVFAQNQA